MHRVLNPRGVGAALAAFHANDDDEITSVEAAILAYLDASEPSDLRESRDIWMNAALSAQDRCLQLEIEKQRGRPMAEELEKALAERPVWVPFTPDTIDDGAIGWLWRAGAWCPVAVVSQSDVTKVVCIIPGAEPDDYEDLAADLFRGRPYIPAHKPSVTPGECDALEVHVSLPGGGSYALAYGDKAGADATLEHLKELLTPKKGKADG